MITFKLYNSQVKDNDSKLYEIYKISIYNKLNIILGDSGIGKSYLVSKLRLAIRNEKPWSYTCKDNNGNNIELYLDPAVEIIEILCNNVKNALIIIDEENTKFLYRNNKIDKLLKSQNYFIILDRRNDIKMDCNVNAVFTLKESIYKNHKIFKTINYIDIKNTEMDNSSTERLEDTKIFMEEN